MKRTASIGLIGMGMAAFVCAGPAQAGPPKDPPTKCAADAVLVGSVCMDKYEASVWRIPDPLGTNKRLVKNVRKGKATAADLTAGGAMQLGTAGDNYAPCTDNGQTCKDDIFAVSLAAATPSAYLTWFQANVACANSGKRLPSNAEWQMAVTGSPDPGGDNGTTDCNVVSTLAVAATGSRSSCVSAFGAFDMVGNLYEWVADWVPRSTTCGRGASGSARPATSNAWREQRPPVNPVRCCVAATSSATVRLPARSPSLATSSRPAGTSASAFGARASRIFFGPFGLSSVAE